MRLEAAGCRCDSTPTPMNAKSQTCLGQMPGDSEAFETAIQAGASDTTALGAMESTEQTTRLVETSSRLAGGDNGSENPAGRFHARVCVPDGPRVKADGSSVKANARRVIADGRNLRTTTSPVKPGFPPLRAPKATKPNPHPPSPRLRGTSPPPPPTNPRRVGCAIHALHGHCGGDSGSLSSERRGLG